MVVSETLSRCSAAQTRSRDEPTVVRCAGSRPRSNTRNRRSVRLARLPPTFRLRPVPGRSGRKKNRGMMVRRRGHRLRSSIRNRRFPLRVPRGFLLPLDPDRPGRRNSLPTNRLLQDHHPRGRMVRRWERKPRTSRSGRLLRSGRPGRNRVVVVAETTPRRKQTAPGWFPLRSCYRRRSGRTQTRRRGRRAAQPRRPRRQHQPRSLAGAGAFASPRKGGELRPFSVLGCAGGGG